MLQCLCFNSISLVSNAACRFLKDKGYEPVGHAQAYSLQVATNHIRGIGQGLVSWGIFC